MGSRTSLIFNTILRNGVIVTNNNHNVTLLNCSANLHFRLRLAAIAIIWMQVHPQIIQLVDRIIPNHAIQI